ncbi:MAG: hypothetical protein HYZ74_08140, partial [Elusimicrobia bacterium]|nr:hypothetical protein [Elusimicrobiota bacterium]
HTFFIEQHFQRYLTPRYARGAPSWFYLIVLPAGLLPWTAPFLAGWLGAARKPSADPRAAALAAWIAGVIAFFSTSHSKLATYALPVFPHAALLAALALDQGLPAWAKRCSRALGGALLAAALAALALAVRPHAAADSIGADPALLRALIILASALIAALGSAQLYAPSARRPALILGAAGLAAGVLAFAGMRAASPLISAKELSLAVRGAAGAGDHVWTYGTYLHGLPFYSGRRVDKMVYFVGEFHYPKREAVYAERFGDDNAVTALPRRGGKTFVAMKTRERAHFETLPSPGSITGWRQFGPWSLAEISAAN